MKTSEEHIDIPDHIRTLFRHEQCKERKYPVYDLMAEGEFTVIRDSLKNDSKFVLIEGDYDGRLNLRNLEDFPKLDKQPLLTAYHSEKKNSFFNLFAGKRDIYITEPTTCIGHYEIDSKGGITGYMPPKSKHLYADVKVIQELSTILKIDHPNRNLRSIYSETTEMEHEFIPDHDSEYKNIIQEITIKEDNITQFTITHHAVKLQFVSEPLVFWGNGLSHRFLLTLHQEDDVALVFAIAVQIIRYIWSMSSE
ncbi:MAG: hypothetical protein INQ03_02310 [Candidatus Heimdallarchaeota archaeon]|nr:hypothetical protein [Candidatus Heimdallarchaeota archaeon]